MAGSADTSGAPARLSARIVAWGRDLDTRPITTASELTDASEAPVERIGVPMFRRLVRLLSWTTGELLRATPGQRPHLHAAISTDHLEKEAHHVCHH
jgi:hypothetical protein